MLIEKAENQDMTKYWRSIDELKDPVEFKKSEIKLELDAKRAVLQKNAQHHRF